MEPTDLKATPPDDPQLEAWLRSSASLPPLADNGFSTRVLAALPPPVTRRSPDRTRILVCVAAALAGTALAAFNGFNSPDVSPQLEAIAPALQQTTDALADPAVPIALGITFVSLVIAFWRDIRLVPRI